MVKNNFAVSDHMPYCRENFQNIFLKFLKVNEITVLPGGDNELELSAFSVEEKDDLKLVQFGRKRKKLVQFMHKFVGD